MDKKTRFGSPRINVQSQKIKLENNCINKVKSIGLRIDRLYNLDQNRKTKKEIFVMKMI